MRVDASLPLGRQHLVGRDRDGPDLLAGAVLADLVLGERRALDEPSRLLPRGHGVGDEDQRRRRRPRHRARADERLPRAAGQDHDAGPAVPERLDRVLLVGRRCQPSCARSIACASPSTYPARSSAGQPSLSQHLLEVPALDGCTTTSASSIRTPSSPGGPLGPHDLERAPRRRARAGRGRAQGAGRSTAARSGTSSRRRRRAARAARDSASTPAARRRPARRRARRRAPQSSGVSQYVCTCSGARSRLGEGAMARRQASAWSWSTSSRSVLSLCTISRPFVVVSFASSAAVVSPRVPGGSSSALWTDAMRCTATVRPASRASGSTARSRRPRRAPVAAAAARARPATRRVSTTPNRALRGRLAQQHQRRRGVRCSLAPDDNARARPGRRPQRHRSPDRRPRHRRPAGCPRARRGARTATARPAPTRRRPRHPPSRDRTRTRPRPRPRGRAPADRRPPPPRTARPSRTLPRPGAGTCPVHRLPPAVREVAGPRDAVGDLLRRRHGAGSGAASRSSGSGSRNAVGPVGATATLARRRAAATAPPARRDGREVQDLPVGPLGDGREAALAQRLDELAGARLRGQDRQGERDEEPRSAEVVVGPRGGWSRPRT